MNIQRMFSYTTLRKRLWRADWLWTRSLAFRGFLKRIPLYLDTRALLESQYWPREKLDELRDARLAELLRHAGRIPFWSEAMGAARLDVSKRLSSVDLEKLPVISKKDLRKPEHKREYYVDPALVAESSYEQTSGSTGKPFGFYHDKSFALRAYAFVERFLRTVGGGVRYPVVSMRVAERVGFAFAGYHFFHVKGYNSLRHRFPQFVELVRSLKEPVILFALSSWVVEVFHLLREERMSLPIRAVIAFGETLRDAQREEIEKTAGIRVSTQYALAELGRLAFECPSRRLHINEEWAHLEIVDDSGKPLPRGEEGRVTVTMFDNFVMPFIRYDTGDRGSIHEEPCPCGRTLRTLSFTGRSISLLTFADGRTVSLVDIASVFDRYLTAIRQFQIVRTGDLSFIMQIIADRRFEELKDTIESHLRRVIHPHAQIAWKTTDALSEGPNGKALYFVDQTAPLHA